MKPNITGVCHNVERELIVVSSSYWQSTMSIIMGHDPYVSNFLGLENTLYLGVF